MFKNRHLWYNFYMAEKRKWTWWAKTLLLKGALLFFVVSLGLVLLYRFAPVPLTPLMVFRSAESIFSDKWVGISKDWVPLEDISPTIQRAVLKAEDYKFYEHNGFDFDAIEKAYKYNKTHLKKKGASTISQQTAKNVFLWPHRDWIRKGMEAYFTVLIEFVWPKDRIMEVYLNVIELGPGVYGVEAAAQKYFKKPAKKLSPYESSLIAAVLPNPRRFKIERPSRYVMHRQRRILFREAPPIPKADAALFQFWDWKLDNEEQE